MQLLACPTLHSGQSVEARVEAGQGVRDVSVRLYASVYDERDQLAPIFGERQQLQSGKEAVLNWRIPVRFSVNDVTKVIVGMHSAE